MPIIQAIPGAGKTTLASGTVQLSRAIPSLRRFGAVIDTDVVISEMGFAGRPNTLLSERALANEFFSRLRGYDDSGRMIVTNLWLENYQVPPADLKVAYRPRDYIRHLDLSGRDDLLTQFSRDTLEGWARDYEGHANVLWLRPGEWLGTVAGQPLMDELFQRWLKRRSRAS